MDSPDRVNILLVDDRPDKLLALEAILADVGVNVVKAQSGREALRRLLNQDFAVILLDVNMPGMDGFETAALIRQRRRSEHTPIIFFTAHSETENHVSQGYSLGAVDYIHTPVVPEVLKTKVRVFVELFRKTEQVKRQAEELREIEGREHQRQIDEAKRSLAEEAKRNLFFVLSIDMLCVVGFDGFAKQLNPAWEKMLGFTEAELKAVPLIEFVHPDDRDATDERRRELEAGTPIMYFENRFRGKDGSYRWLGWTAAPFVAEKLLYLCGRDITWGKKAEQEQARRLDEEQRRAAHLESLTAASLAINAAPSIDAMVQVIADQAREIVGAHQALARLTADPNWSQARHAISRSGALAGLASSEGPGFEPALSARAIELNRTLRLTQAELEAHPVLGPFLADIEPSLRPRGWLSAPLTGREGRNMGLIQVSDRTTEGDFTDEDEAVLMQLAHIAASNIENALYREAREANRLKDEFLAMLSHELRTPLNAMLGWTGLLRTGKLDAASAARALEVIQRNVKAQAKIIDDLLDVSRIITGKLQLNAAPVQVGPVVEAAIDAMRPEAEAKGIHLDATLEAAAECVSGDPDRLQQVVWNLLSNAIKFTPRGGQVEVRLRRSDADVELTVRDTGEGISPELLPYIFNRFWQADRSGARPHGGLGLGLAIVRHLVKLHGGIVQAESRGKGHGATFTARLPILKDVADLEAGPPVLETPRQPMSGERLPLPDGLKVLVVEDEADNRDLIVAVLEECGGRVTGVASAREALEALDWFRPDVLVSDIGMPGEDGYFLIRKVRARSPDRGGTVPAVALTAYAGEEDHSRALAAGFQIHVPKPVDVARLVAAIATLGGTGQESVGPQRKGEQRGAQEPQSEKAL